jgi:hypothetical protein
VFLLAARRNHRNEHIFGGRKRRTKRRRAVFLLSFATWLETNAGKVNELDQRAASIIG